MEPELHGGCFKKKSKSAFTSFWKFRIKFLSVDNVDRYQYAKYNFKIRFILGYKNDFFQV